jgi:hypothetical protein
VIVALPLVAPIPVANPYRLSKRTRLLLWLLSMRPEVDGVNLMPTHQHLERCLEQGSKKPRR